MRLLRCRNNDGPQNPPFLDPLGIAAAAAAAAGVVASLFAAEANFAADAAGAFGFPSSQCPCLAFSALGLGFRV